MTTARLADAGSRLVCGRQYPTGHYCEVELFRVSKDGHATGDSDWRRFPEDFGDPTRWSSQTPRYVRTGWSRKKRGYAPTREGFAPVLGPVDVKAPKAIQPDRPAECPQCHVLNDLPAQIHPWSRD